MQVDSHFQQQKLKEIRSPCVKINLGKIETSNYKKMKIFTTIFPNKTNILILTFQRSNSSINILKIIGAT